jgi:cytochrome c5
MLRVLAAAVAVALAAPALAQAAHRAGDAPAHPAAAAPAAAAQPAAAAPAAAPKGPRELEQAKKLGRQGLVKIAPRLGSRAEKLAKDKGGDVVDKAVDLAAEATGLVPKK